MFEEASKLRLRFNTEKGNLSVEDLWDLPLLSTTSISLDGLAKSLYKEIKESNEKSFVVKKSKANKILVLKFDIVKHVIKNKLEDIERKEADAIAGDKLDKILNVIAEKEGEELKDESLADLRKMAKKLKTSK